MTAGGESTLSGGHTLGSANRRCVAIFARRVSFAFDLLAAIAAVAGAKRLAECVADAAWGAG